MRRKGVRAYFDERFVRNYDRCIAPLERAVFAEARTRLAARARGRVLDVGAGTGANFGRFGPEVCSVAGIDPEPGMLAQARLPEAVPVRLIVASGECLPFASGVFDTVVATLVLCTIPDPTRAYAEMMRVLAPGGLLLLLEHVRSSSSIVAAVQDAATPLNRVLAGGCHLNRRTEELLRGPEIRVEARRERLAGSVVEIVATRLP